MKKLFTFNVNYSPSFPYILFFTLLFFRETGGRFTCLPPADRDVGPYDRAAARFPPHSSLLPPHCIPFAGDKTTLMVLFTAHCSPRRGGPSPCHPRCSSMQSKRSTMAFRVLMRKRVAATACFSSMSTAICISSSKNLPISLLLIAESILLKTSIT